MDSSAAPDPFQQAADVQAALGDAHRLHLLMLLRARPACVCELVELTPLSQPAVSQHLKRLRSAALVQEQRRGRWMIYALSAALPPYVAALLESLPEPPGTRELRRRPLAASCAETSVRPGRSR